jgi:glycosyltransferase involved in cell wall biosynthesis
MAPIKQVLVVLPVGERGGAESLFYDILRLLDKERFAPTVFFLRDGPFVDEVRELGVRTFVEPITRLGDPINFVATVLEIKRIIAMTETALVFSSLGYAHLYGGLAASLAHVPAVWWQHGIASSENLIDRLASKIPARLVIASSRAAAAAHCRVFGGSDQSVRTVYPGVPIEQFQCPQLQRLERIRHELGLDQAAAVVATVGRLQPGKGQDVFIQAAKLVSEAMPGVKYLVIGREMFGLDVGYSSLLKRSVIDLGLESDIVFTGFRDDIPELLAVTDMVVHAATMPESFGLALCEAMAAGKPVVATDVGGPSEVVVDGETGYVVTPNDAGALAEAMLKLLKGPTRLLEMGEAARRRVRERFDIQRTVSEVEQILEEFSCSAIC